MNPKAIKLIHDSGFRYQATFILDSYSIVWVCWSIGFTFLRFSDFLYNQMLLKKYHALHEHWLVSLSARCLECVLLSY